jgi:excisionase family DNA binding protein
MTLSEVAAYLKVTPGTIYRLLKRNEIPGFKLNRRAWRCNRESIDQWRFTASRCRTSK